MIKSYRLACATTISTSFPVLLLGKETDQYSMRKRAEQKRDAQRTTDFMELNRVFTVVNTAAIRPAKVVADHSALDLLAQGHSVWWTCTVGTARRRSPVLRTDVLLCMVS